MTEDVKLLYEAVINGQQALIGLLARNTIGVERILEIVKRGKKNPDAYVVVYNALDGSKSGTELAKLVGVTQQAMSYVLKTWEEEGIAYVSAQAKYKKLLTLPVPRPKSAKSLNESQEELPIERAAIVEN